jgi:hypothetical protein
VTRFSSIFNPSSIDIPSNVRFTFCDFLNVPLISNSDIKQAVGHPSPSRCIVPDYFLSFIFKGCSEMFGPLLSHIFRLVGYKESFQPVEASGCHACFQ